MITMMKVMLKKKIILKNIKEIKKNRVHVNDHSYK